jgi:ubiquinone/menaquinone biosynthesis C-methylase UbiE
MPELQTQKTKAIHLHSLQAGLFASRYGNLQADAYADCFAYSRHRLEALLGRYLPDCGEGRRLLDVGCGTGHHMAALGQRGFEVAGVDGSPEMLEHARTLNPGADVRLSDVESLPYPDGSFDYVLCIEVLRYLSDPARCIHEMARVLAPGGVALFTAIPLLNLNAYWLVNRLAGRLGPSNLVRLRQFFTTSARLRRHCHDAGFRTPRIHGVYFGPINWVERLARPILPRALRGWERLDQALADHPALRDFSNMFLVHGVRK